MRILIIGLNYAPEVTGIAPYTTGLAEGLCELGHSVTVLTGMPHYPEWRVDDEYSDSDGVLEVRNGVRVRRFPHFVPRGGSMASRVRMEVSFGRRVASAHWGDPDVVITVSPALVAASMIVTRAKAEGVPVGVIVQDLYGLGLQETSSGGGLSARAAMGFETKVLTRADGVSVIHDHFRDSVVDMGVPRGKITTIRNWSHLQGWSHPSEAQIGVTRARYGWSDREIIVLHTGNMGLKQGLLNVVEAARYADKTNADVRFVLVGDGNQRSELEHAAKGTTRIQFVRPLPGDEFTEILSAADLLLVNELPGVSGMAVPSKLTSYFTAGRPVLGAVDASGVTASEIRASGAGIIVPAGDPQQLVTDALELGSDMERCDALAALGPIYATTVLGRDEAVSRYESWCAELATGETGRAAGATDAELTLAAQWR